MFTMSNIAGLNVFYQIFTHVRKKYWAGTSEKCQTKQSLRNLLMDTGKKAKLEIRTYYSMDGLNSYFLQTNPYAPNNQRQHSYESKALLYADVKPIFTPGLSCLTPWAVLQGGQQNPPATYRHTQFSDHPHFCFFNFHDSTKQTDLLQHCFTYQQKTQKLRLPS